MPGLNDMIMNTAQQTTTLPTWFDSAQQDVVNQANAAFKGAPTPQDTVAQGAVDQLSGTNNAFTNATGTLQNIATGAANPWITGANGQVTPNTNTAMGGLFQAQNQQLNQLMPNVTAPIQGANVGSGNFGSLRGQTAYNKAIGDAQAALTAQQMQAALQNQQTGVQAAQGAGNVAQQGINNALTVGQYQQASPFTNVSNYGKILGGIQAPTTVSNQTQLSPLNQIAGAMALLSGTKEGTGLLSNAGGLLDSIKGLFGGSGLTLPTPYSGYTDTTGGVYGPTPDGGNIVGDPVNVTKDDDGNLLPKP